MMGAKPKYLTCSVIIEEGFEVEQLEKIVASMKEELEKNNLEFKEYRANSRVKDSKNIEEIRNIIKKYEGNAKIFLG